MTHLLSDGSPNGLHIAVHPHARFKTVLRIPREQHIREQRIYWPRHAQAVPIARYRRHRTWRELGVDVVLGYVLPASVLLFIVFCVVCFFWLGWAIDRAIRSIGGP